MKILHVCLAAFYIDNYSYQENILPKYHQKMGYDVEIVASLETFDNTGKLVYLAKPSNYFNEHSIEVTRLEHKRGVCNKKLRRYKGLEKFLLKSSPDIIFIHGCQFYDIKYIVEYVKKNPKVKIYVDNHADFSNSAKNWISKNVLHKYLWRRAAKSIEPYTKKFYGVLPARVDFLKDIYGIASEKIELLVMGVDDDLIKETKNSHRLEKLEKELHTKDYFTIITGGKIDSAKLQTLTLMKIVKNLSVNYDIKLLIFGSLAEEVKEEFNQNFDNSTMSFLGWLSNKEIYEHIIISDLAVFPGRHSVLWEQVVGLGKPMIVKKWDGTTHVDVGGNVKFLNSDTYEELEVTLENLIRNRNEYSNMKRIAKEKGQVEFSYTKIAEKSLTH